MTERELLKLATRLLSLPTAPYHEHAVRAYVEDHARQLGLPVTRDRAGNVIVRYRGAGAPLVYLAHMDHPGFEALGGRRAEFLGGVPKKWFPGARVRFYRDLECGDLSPLSSSGQRQSADKSAHSKITAKVKRVLPGWPRRKLVELDVKLRRGQFGMWDLPGPRVRTGKLFAPAIDDVLSVAVVLATLSELVRRRVKTHVWGVFSRAEEVGFHGTYELIKARRIPRGALVVSMEMSKARPWARIGDGPIVRVGDRLTTFDAAGVYYFQTVAKRSAIRAQRCLMDGGACEATAVNALGYRACGLCLPLGNYHNIGADRKIRSEYVSVTDLRELLQLTVAGAREWRNRGAIEKDLRMRMERIRRHAPRELKD